MQTANSAHADQSETELLKLFSPASSALLTSRALLRRTDTKFLIRRTLLPELLALLQSDYAVVFSGNKTMARYKTRYLDTPELGCFHDHRRGRRIRFKVRFRHYVDRNKSFLEIKRRGKIGTDKVRFSRDYLDDSFNLADRDRVLDATWQRGHGLVQAIDNSFSRIMLVGLHTPERVTLDVDLAFTQGQQSLQLEQVAIIEVKQEKYKNRSPIMLALRNISARPSSASKYCIGTMLLNPHVRGTRLTPTARKITKMESNELVRGSI